MRSRQDGRVSRWAEFIVRGPAGSLDAGWIAETDEGTKCQRAEEALGQVIGAGLFVITVERTFTFSHHASSLEELRAHLADTWSDAVTEPLVAERVESLMAGGGVDRELVLCEAAWMMIRRRGTSR